MDEDTRIAVVAIERSNDPTKIRLRFMDNDDREAAITLSDIKPGQDTSDIELLQLATSLIQYVGSIDAFVENSVQSARQ